MFGRSLAIQVLSALMTSSVIFASDRIPERVLVDRSWYEGRHAGLYDDVHYLWLSVEQAGREREKRRLGLDDEQDVWFHSLDMFEEAGLDGEGDSWLGKVIQVGAARKYGLRDGQRLPEDRFEEVCGAAEAEQSDSVLARAPSFRRHVEEARGAVLGRVVRIAHGFNGPIPALLLELDVEETLLTSKYSLHPWLVVPTGGYVHDGTVYCSIPGLGRWSPEPGDRLIALPVTGPWDKDGRIMPIVDASEVLLVDEPDDQAISPVVPLLPSWSSSVPKTLLDFRHRFWDLRDAVDRPPP